MEPGNKKSAFKLRSGNKPSIAKLAGLKDLFGKLQDIGQKAKDFKEKRQSESRINIKQDMEDKIARTRRGESKFQEKTRMRKEFNKFKRKNKDVKKPSEIKETKIKTPEVKKSTDDSKQKSKGYYHAFSGKKGDKFKYRSGPDGGNYLEGYEFQYPEDDKRYKGPDHWETPKTKAGKQAIHDLYISDYPNRKVEITPITKRKYKKKK